MPLAALKAVAKPQNGVGAFILPCKSLTFHYCNWWGSSRGMNSFIKTYLPTFATRNPGIEFSVEPQHNQHPVIIAHYINGAKEEVCVKNMGPEEVKAKAEYLRIRTGEKDRKLDGRPVGSLNQSVRGVWSPFHGAKVRL